MNLRTKLTTVLLACGIVPMSLSVTLAHFSSQDNNRRLIDEATEALQTLAEQKLTGQLASRARHVKSYFEAIEDHIASMAMDEGVHTAMQAFTESFAKLRSDNQLDDAKVTELTQQLAGYYRSAFAGEYRRQNGDKPAPVEGALALVDAPMAIAQHYYVKANPHPLGQKQNLDRAGDASQYSEAHARFHPWLRDFQQKFGYYDVFLIDPQGRIVYSVFKEVDFGSSLATGPWQHSPLGELFRKLQGTPPGSYAFADFATYAPSFEAPAAFVGSPIVKDGNCIGHVAFQMPIDRINAIAASTEGLGETGEIVLVGADRKMRSDSRHDPENLTVVASFRRPETGKLDLEPVKLAIEKGEKGTVNLTDRDGAEELCAYAPIEVLGQRWAALAKMEHGEIFVEQGHMQKIGAEAQASMLAWSLGLVLATSALVAALAFVLSRQLTSPIQKTVDALKDIAEGEGDLTRRLAENDKDELGQLGMWFNRFLSRLQGTIRELGHKAQGVTSASTQLMATAASLAAGADRTMAQSTQVAAAAEQMTANMNSVSSSSDAMAGTLRTVAAAVEEMTASIGEVAKSADGAARVAGEAADLTRTSNQKISQLGAAANEIGRVIETIQDIAEQTNLLALNATIEAARAGEAGKGFSVVANEVKDLARQTAEATQDIRQRIERIQSSTQESIDAIGAIDKVIAQVSNASQTIANSVSEQRTATQEIAQNLAANTKTVEIVNRNVAECVTTSREISKSIQEVDQNAQTTASGAGETEQAGKGLGSLAHELQQIVMQFRV
jgi:methyl-accepting chemotaxis protein